MSMLGQDIATVDILERAQGVDPVGERTVGVLTKTDLIGPGGEDEVLAVVNNVRKPLALGYVMLKNRSQRDLMDNISTQQARLKSHAAPMASTDCCSFIVSFCQREGRGVFQKPSRVQGL